MNPPASAPRSTRAAATRAALIDAAQHILAEGGEDTSMLGIAQRAGVSVGSLYNHFGSRDALWDAAAIHARDTYAEWLIGLTADIEDPLEALAVRMRIYGRVPQTHPVHARMLANPRCFRAMSVIANPVARDTNKLAMDALGAEVDEQAALVVGTGTFQALVLMGIDDPLPPELIDETIATALTVLGLPLPDARELCHRPLPDLPPQERLGA